MTQSKRAVVVGGSLGGLFAANLLFRAGWDVHVYERVAQELESRGAGIVTHPELMDALHEAGVVVDDSIGVNVKERVTLGKDGTRVGSRSLPQTLTAWARLYGVLKAAFPNERYHNAKHLVSFSQDAREARATFADGKTVTGDILIAADGVRSAVRQSLLPATRPLYAGYVAWRGLVEESSLSESALKDVFPYFAFTTKFAASWEAIRNSTATGLADKIKAFEAYAEAATAANKGVETAEIRVQREMLRTLQVAQRTGAGIADSMDRARGSVERLGDAMHTIGPNQDVKSTTGSNK